MKRALRGLAVLLVIAALSPVREAPAAPAKPTVRAPARPAVVPRRERLPFDRDGAPVFLVGAELRLGDGTNVPAGIIEIRGTRIAAVGGRELAAKIPGDAQRIDLAGKVVTPGLVAADTNLGLVEIDAEASTRDDGRAGHDLVRAAYEAAASVNADSSLLQVAAIDGITSAAVTPQGGLVAGRVAWIDLVQGDHRTIVSRPVVGMRASLGQVVAGSRAATLATLREVLDDARFYRDRRAAFDRRQTRDLSAHRLDLEALAPVLARDFPLVVWADRVSDMRALVSIAREFRVDVAILGGTQAWRIADELAEAKVRVIVQPTRNLPGALDQLGARLDNAAILSAAGVEVGIAVLGEAHNVRNATQEAGIAVANGLDPGAALRAITLTIARTYGMDAHYGSLAAGKVANLVIWDGDPFELSERPSSVWIRGRAIPLVSRQTRLRDRYRDLGRTRAKDGRR